MGLDGALRAKRDRFIGILNGLDTTVWDPANDDDLAAPYSRDDRAGKADCRADLLGRIGFDADDPGLVIGMIGRLDPQKGFDLLEAATPALLERGVRLVVQGSGHPSLADPVSVGSPTPGPIASRSSSGFDRVMARRIYAGRGLLRDAVALRALRPGQMIALRYGTPPIVHDVGGLADTGDRRDDASRSGDRLSRSELGHGRGTCSTRATRRCDCACAAAGRGRRLLDRAMGGRLRLGDGIGAALRRRVPASGVLRVAGRGSASRRATRAAPQSSRRGDCASASVTAGGS
jgi:glycogen synthase